MTNTEQFVAEMRALCEKYNVEISKMRAYYPEDPQDIEFYLKDEGKLFNLEELFGNYYRG